MSLNALLYKLVRQPFSAQDSDTPYQANTSKLSTRLVDVFLRTYDLGLTAFGGPPVHFQILHRRFVDGLGKTPWIDEQTYQELFGISQALPGPASTKMVFNIAQIHAGLLPAIFVFLLWSLPGAIAMYGLSLGVQRIGDVLPAPAYALLSGLNAATVGIIALAAVQLARKAITDKLTRILVVVGGCAGLCYNALWYLPVLIVVGGLSALIWDTFGRRWIRRIKMRRRSVIGGIQELVPREDATAGQNPDDITISPTGPQRRQALTTATLSSITPLNPLQESDPAPQPSQNDISAHSITLKCGISLIVLFFTAFATFITLRAVLFNPPLLLSLFNNMFLAGTIIFGGGPVVIPLLRDYVVEPGWVSPRDFLLGLAIIQAMPGPNFNFAVYLGALTIAGSGGKMPSIVGALTAFLGIFAPGLWLSVGFQSIWRVLRKRREVMSLLRGVNAAAVGFVFTAVYRLWEIGYLTTEQSKGVSLGQEPWWLIVAATTFTIVEWFSIPPAVAILLGGIAGLGWWGATQR